MNLPLADDLQHPWKWWYWGWCMTLLGPRFPPVPWNLDRHWNCYGTEKYGPQIPCFLIIFHPNFAIMCHVTVNTCKYSSFMQNPLGPAVSHLFSYTSRTCFHVFSHLFPNIFRRFSHVFPCFPTYSAFIFPISSHMFPGFLLHFAMGFPTFFPRFFPRRCCRSCSCASSPTVRGAMSWAAAGPGALVNFDGS